MTHDNFLAIEKVQKEEGRAGGCARADYAFDLQVSPAAYYVGGSRGLLGL